MANLNPIVETGQKWKGILCILWIIDQLILKFESVK